MNIPLTHRTGKTISAGRHYPLGATLSSAGVNFALYSENAEKVFLLLFDEAGTAPTDVIRLPNRTKYVWHVFVSGLKAGQLYAYKVRGKRDPGRGLRFNEQKLLIDPYAKALTHKCMNKDNLLLAYDANAEDRDLSLDLRNNASLVPKSIVIDDAFDWQGDVSARRTLCDGSDGNHVRQ